MFTIEELATIPLFGRSTCASGSTVLSQISAIKNAAALDVWWMLIASFLWLACDRQCGGRRAQ
jgi:hypothetical protein